MRKEEMERIWKEEPIGYMDRKIDLLDGKNGFIVTWKPYKNTKTYADEISVTVYAKNAEKAKKKAESELTSELYKRHKWEYNCYEISCKSLTSS